MRLALLSDIHANAPALRVVLADLAHRKVDRIWVLGDVVGYGPLAGSCFAMLDEQAPSLWLAGNHDRAALLLLDGKGLDDPVVTQLVRRYEDRLVAQWHADQLRVACSPERLDLLRAAPTWQEVEAGLYASHGCILSADPNDNANIIGDNSYCNASSAGRELMVETLAARGDMAPRLVIVGHTHIPTVGQRLEANKWNWQAGNQLPFNDAEPVQLPDPAAGFVVLCPGSVGDPRVDRDDMRAAYALLDLDRCTVEFRRVAYNLAETEAAQLPMPETLHELRVRRFGRS